MKYLYLLFFLSLSLLSFSQKTESDKKIDSLLVVLNAKREDTAKVNVYQSICEQYGGNDYKKTIFYNVKILQLSKKNNYKRGIGFYYYNLSQINENTGKDGIEVAKKAASIFLDTHDVQYYLQSNEYICNSLFKTGKTEEVSRIVNKSLPIALPTKYYAKIGNLYTFMGLVSYKEINYKKALEYYKTALSYYNKTTNSNDNKSELFLYMAFIHTDLGNYQETIRYIDLSNSIQETIGNNLEKALALNKLQRYEEALKILLKNKNPNLTKSENQNIYNSYLIAETYFNLKKYSVAIENLEKLTHKKTNFYNRLSCCNLLASCYIKQKNFLKAKKCNDSALLKIDSSKVNIPGTKESAFLSKSEIEEATGNYYSSLLYYKKYNKLIEENNTKNTTDKIQQLQIDLDVLEKDSNIKNLKQIDKNRSLILGKQKNYLILSSLLLLVALCFVLFIIRTNRISEQKNKIIENTNVALQKSITEKETLLREIHHRVKNNLQLVMSLLYIQSKEKGTNLDDFIEISQSRILSMSLIHENLYNAGDLSKVDFKDYLHKLTHSIIGSNGNSGQNILIQIDMEDLYFDIQTAIPLGLIINELISNAYKHAFVNRSEGIISIAIKPKEEGFEIVIKDNGVGMTKKEISKKTLGQELVKQLVAQINGVLEIKNDLGMQYIIHFKNISY